MNTGQYRGQLRQPNGAPVAIKGLWDLEFGDGPPDNGKANWLYFDAGPNPPGDSTSGLFGVILAAGDQGNQLGRQEHRSLVSTSIASSPTRSASTMSASMIPTSTMSSPNGILQPPSDAILQELDGVLLSLDANLSAMHAPRSGFFAMLPSNLDALDATVLDRLDAGNHWLVRQADMLIVPIHQLSYPVPLRVLVETCIRTLHGDPPRSLDLARRLS